MEFRNGVMLQLIECIESTQNEVKRKMIEAEACNVAPKSHARHAREKSSRHLATYSQVFFRQVEIPRERLRRNASLRARRDYVLRTFAKVHAIYNERRFLKARFLTERLEGAHLWPVRMM
jgi:hypothetical protein